MFAVTKVTISTSSVSSSASIASNSGSMESSTLLLFPFCCCLVKSHCLTPPTNGKQARSQSHLVFQFFTMNGVLGLDSLTWNRNARRTQSGGFRFSLKRWFLPIHRKNWKKVRWWTCLVEMTFWWTLFWWASGRQYGSRWFCPVTSWFLAWCAVSSAAWKP